jgi:hypothetical protein
MKQVLYTSEVLGNVETDHGAGEVCVTAEARYDEDAGRLEVELDAFLRTTDLCAKEARLPAGWLPKAETVRESAGSDEAVDLARDIFHRWVRKVREAAPALSHA